MNNIESNNIETNKNVFDYKTIYENCLITENKDYQKPEFLLKYDKSEVFFKQNLSVITGHAGSGKTFAITLLVTELLKPNIELHNISIETANDIKILWFDTEQAPFRVNQIRQRIMHLSNANNENFKIFSLKDIKTEHRNEFVQAAILQSDANFIIIDGIRDLIKSINDEAIATEIIDNLQSLLVRKNCHILNVLHTNKSNDNLRGWIGSELTNKSDTVIEISKDKSGNNGIFEINFTKIRSTPIKDSLKFEVEYDEINNVALPKWYDNNGTTGTDGMNEIKAKKNNLMNLK